MALTYGRKPKNQPQEGEVIVSTGRMAIHGVIKAVDTDKLSLSTLGGNVTIDLHLIKFVLPKLVAA